MADKGTIATGYVQILPSTEGMKGNLTAQLTQEASSAGKASGQSIASSVSAELGKAGGTMTKAGKAMSVAVTAPLVGMATGAVNAASTFESAMAQVQTIADPTEKTIDEIRQAIIDLSNETGQSADSLAAATYSAISAGQSTADAVGFVKEAAMLSKAGFTDMTTATDTLTTALNAYGLASDEVTSISDKLITTQNLGKTTVAELGSSLGKVIPTAAAYGVNIDQLASAYVTTTKNGIATAESGTYINSMLNELGKSGTTASNVLKEKTGKSFKELMDGGSSLTDVLGILQANADETGVSMMDMFGSAEAGKASATLTQHADDFSGAVIAMGDSAGTTQQAFETMESTTATSFEKMKTQATNSMIELGNALLPIITPVIGQITSLVSQISSAWNSLDEDQQQMILKIAGIAAAAGPVLSIGGKVVSGIGKISGGIGGLIGKFSSASKATSTLTSAASGVGTAAQGASSGVGALAKNAVGFVALGAGILMAAAGLALLAKSATDLVAAGPSAGIALAGMVGAIALFAVGAAALAPALTAGAVGLVAFGAGIALVGAGIFLATSGISLLAAQLPTISIYGGTASASILKMSSAAAAFGISALAAGTGATAAGAGLIVCGVGALSSSVGFAAASVSVALLAASLILVSTQMRSISSDARESQTALSGLVGSVDIVSEGLGALKSTAKGAIGAIADAFSGAAPDAKTASASMMNGINQNVDNGMKSSLSSVKAGLLAMQKAFAGTRFSFNQKIALPHFSMVGAFDARTGSVPSVGVDWFANGGILTGATIFGAMQGRLLAGGESGPEAVIPIDTLKDYISEAMEEERKQVTFNQTVNNYSPKALSPSEAARQTRNATRQMILQLRRS